MMWIRSQNKKYFVKSNFVCVDFNLVKCSNDAKVYVIGEYANSERALEVLNEIQNNLNKEVFEMPEE